MGRKGFIFISEIQFLWRIVNSLYDSLEYNAIDEYDDYDDYDEYDYYYDYNNVNVM